MSLGSRIRGLRESRGMSMKELASRVNVSPSMISQMERDLANPSVKLLSDVAEELGVKVGMLFGDNDYTNPVVRKGERKIITYQKGKQIQELLAPITNSKIEFILNRYQPGISGSVVAHEGEECGLVLQGTAEIRVNGQVYTLEEGDCIHHDSTVPHSIKNVGDDELIMVYAITPPSF